MTELEEALKKELLFWKRKCEESMARERDANRKVIALEQEIDGFTTEYGVEDPDGEIFWFSGPESKRMTLEEQKREARAYADTDIWFDLVSRQVGPARKEI